MRTVYITHASAVTALGTLDQTWNRLLAGETGIQELDLFDTTNYMSPYAAVAPDLEEHPDSRICSFLEVALLDLPTLPHDTPLLLATTKAGIDCLEQRCRDEATNPFCWGPADILNAVSERAAIGGPRFNINAACASSTIAIARGAGMIATGKADSALIVCADIVSEFVFSGFSALKAMSDQPARPFDRNRNGLTLGEGAAAIVLMNDAAIERTGLAPLGCVGGWGVANDANHVTAPARDGCGLIQATRNALACADIEPGDIAAINAHGTATVFNDLMELKAFHAVFGDHTLPIHSVKGALGHTLGAAGGIEVALVLRSLADQRIPPTIGFTEPEEGAENQLSDQTQAFAGDAMLTTNSGFGGINGALIITRKGAQS